MVGATYGTISWNTDIFLSYWRVSFRWVHDPGTSQCQKKTPCFSKCLRSFNY